MFTLLAFALLPLVTPRATADAGIVWQKDAEAALARAAAEKRVVFVAVNMDGEAANERLVAKVYTDKAVVALSAHTLNVVASASEHVAGDKPCPRFAGLTCLDHRRADTLLRRDVLKADSEGFVVAPQHVFLDANGKVLLSVPYEITSAELTWCFAAALHAADPASTVTAPPGARAPKRLIQGGVFDPAAVPGGSVRPLSHKEIVELIAELRKSGRGQWELEKLRRLLASDDADAREFIALELKSGGGGGGGRGGGGRGGGGGAAAAAASGNGDARHARIVHAIGVLSPASWWEIAADALGSSAETVRAEAAVALEQLCAPEAVKSLTAALQDEKEPAVQKELLRALGTCGASDKNVRTLLLKRVKSEKDELLRLNAIVATGSLAPGDDVAAELERFANTGSAAEQHAALCAIALSRDARYETLLAAKGAVAAPAAGGAGDKPAANSDLAALATTALAIVHGGDLKALREPLQRVCKDTLERERFFGRARARD